MKTLFAAVSTVAVLLSGCASAPAPAPNMSDNAAKMNLIEPGMPTQQVMQILGTPNSSEINTNGFRCAEFHLKEYSTTFPHGHSNAYFVTLYQGRVVASGQERCSFELRDSNFAPKTPYSAGGKYWQVLNPQK